MEGKHGFFSEKTSGGSQIRRCRGLQSNLMKKEVVENKGWIRYEKREESEVSIIEVEIRWQRDQ